MWFRRPKKNKSFYEQDPWIASLHELQHHIENCHRCKTFGLTRSNCQVATEILTIVWKQWTAYLGSSVAVERLRDVLEWEEEYANKGGRKEA